MQEDILVTQVVYVKFPGRVAEYDVIAIVVMEVVPNAPQFGALAAPPVSAEQVVPSVGGHAHQHPLGNAQGPIERAVTVLAPRRLGIHPTGIVVTVERFVELQGSVHVPKAIGHPVHGDVKGKHLLVLERLHTDPARRRFAFPDTGGSWSSFGFGGEEFPLRRPGARWIR